MAMEPSASALASACTALTSDDLPVPRAPHKSTLLAGSPLAKRNVLSKSFAFCGSIPFKRAIGRRLTRVTGSIASGSVCQMKALTSAGRHTGSYTGLRRSRAAAMRSRVSRTCAISFMDLTPHQGERGSFLCPKARDNHKTDIG